MASAPSTHEPDQESGRVSQTIKIGTRKSKLALAQADLVSHALQKAWPDHKFEICGHNTAAGDVDKITPFKDMPVKNIWTHDLERMLVEKELHLLVHSLKDVPTQLPPGCTLGVVPVREDPRDVFVAREGSSVKSMSDLPPGSVVGTSSIRRTAQVALKYPHLQVQDVRGNIPTRLAKLDARDGPFHGLILAAAGLLRIDLGHRITQYLDSRTGGMLHAVGQGAVGVEIREEDEDVRKLVAPINHDPALLACLTERSLLRTLEGGCSAPLGVETEWHKDKVTLSVRATVVSPDGKESVELLQNEVVERSEDAERFGFDLAQQLVKRGAGKILADIQQRKRPTEVLEL